MLANDGHCIGIVVAPKESDVLDPGYHRSPGRGVLLARHFTLPASGGTLVASCVKDVGVATLQISVVQYQDAANLIVYTVA